MSSKSREKSQTSRRELDRATVEALWRRASRNLRELRAENHSTTSEPPKGRAKAKRA